MKTRLRFKRTSTVGSRLLESVGLLDALSNERDIIRNPVLKLKFNILSSSYLSS